MSYSNILKNLFNLQRRGIKLGLEHTFRLFDEINNPQDNFMCIHVAGTNGKGTTSALIQKMLISSGRKVGLYTSPHLIRFNERIRVNGKMISDDDIIEFFKRVQSAIDLIKSTFFEVTTAMAFEYFKKQKVDVAVIETGLGGRLDSTNIINPKLSVITPVSLDHQSILGEKIEDIAYEKAGIIKKFIPVIVGKQKKEVDKIIIKKAKQQKSKIHKINYKLLTKVKPSATGTSFCYDQREYSIPLIGKHQVENAILALESVRVFDKTIELDYCRQGMETIIWPGRIQKLKKNIYFDVSHNFSGIRVTVDTLKKVYPNKKLAALMCLKKDKNMEDISTLVTSCFEKIYVFNNSNELLMSGNKLYESLSGKGVESIELGSIKNCIDNLKGDVKDGYIGLIFGSHYIAEEIYEVLEISFDAEII